jgi:hypothetical protein
MANAPVLKTGGRKPLGVRIPRPPLNRMLIGSAVALTIFSVACAPAMGDPPDACPHDATVYSYSDSARGVAPPVVLKSQMPGPGLSRTTSQGIVGPNGRIERGSIRSFGGNPEERIAAGDALFWTRFYPATFQGCAVRFLYRVTYMGGIPQLVPDEIPDTTRR